MTGVCYLTAHTCRLALIPQLFKRAAQDVRPDVGEHVHELLPVVLTEPLCYQYQASLHLFRELRQRGEVVTTGVAHLRNNGDT